MTCVYGQLEVYGHIINQGQPPQDVFSVYTHSYLTINGVPYAEPEKSEKAIRREIRALLKPCTKLGNWLPLPMSRLMTKAYYGLDVALIPHGGCLTL